MLVLSRRPNQSVVFPNLGVSVEVLRVAGKAVKIGVKAPEEVKVLRGELAESWETQEAAASAARRRHEFRNRLNTANLSLHLLSKQLETGRIKDADKSLEHALQALAELDRSAVEDGEVDRSNSGRRRTALVVEDNPNERELFSGLLRMSGYGVDAVPDGSAALNYLDSHATPDVVLLDMMMPRMNGPATVRAIRAAAEFKELRVFAVSGMTPDDAGVRLGREGVDRWFRKPIQPAEFAMELDAALVA